ncbi:MAG: DUF58 domain-containing protein [Verrucomicrobiota bacterium]
MATSQATVPSGLIDPEDFQALQDLELVSTSVVEGYLSGTHRSRLKGGCTEFAEHRAYSPGDEVRLVDWRVYAKSDRYYIKQFDEETNLNAVLLLDGSGSMAFSMGAPSKYVYARAACACFARLLLSQRDPVGLMAAGGSAPGYLPPRSRASHLPFLFERLQQLVPEGETSLLQTLDEAVRRVHRRGVFLIFSDCFVDIDQLQKALHLIRSRGHQVVLFHTMAPEELTFEFNRGSRFRCLEVDGHQVDLDLVVIREDYLAGVDRFLTQLRTACARVGCDYVPMNTGENLGERLALYLRERSARAKKGGRG